MTPFKIHYRSDVVTAALTNLKAALADMTPAYQDIGEYLVESTKRRFRDGVGPDGTPWAPKSQTTIDAYAARGDAVSLKPLIGPTRRLSSEIAYEATNRAVSVGSSLIYALTQQLGAAKGAFGTNSHGSPIPWGNIPARPYLGLGGDDESNIVAILVEHLEGGGV